MGTNKTVTNSSSVDDFIANLSDPAQRDDSIKLLAMFSDITGQKPAMWGSAIVGYGTVSLTYASGREVDWLRCGFSPRKGKISLYVTFDDAKLTQRFSDLGKFKNGKGCIYINKLDDVNADVLGKLIKYAWDTGYEQPKRDDGKEEIISSP